MVGCIYMQCTQAGRVEAEKGASVTTLLANARRAADEREAELRKAMRDGEGKLQTRICQLETESAGLRRFVKPPCLSRSSDL